MLIRCYRYVAGICGATVIILTR